MAEDVELAGLRRQLDDLEQLIPIGFWDYDVATVQVSWSPGLHRLYGTDPATFEPSFDAWAHLTHPDDRRMLTATVGRALERLEDYGIDHRFYRASDGALRWSRSNGRIEPGPDGRARRIWGVSTDVTEEHLAAAGFRELIVNAAHELRTPAFAIVQAVETLRAPLSDDDRAAVEAALDRQVARLRRLTSDLVELGQIDDRPSAAMRQPVDVCDAVQSALELAPPPPGRSVVLDGLPPGLEVRAGSAQLERILVNLLTNAWRYGGPTVSISAHREGRRVEIEVADDGPGIPDEARATLFQPFQRSQQRHPDGSGLGLAIVEGLARHLGGSVAYRPGMPGAVFVLTLDAVTR